jgi:DNA polymerase-3 subunit epsilon
MGLLNWLRRAAPALNTEEQARLLALPQPAALSSEPLRKQRWVVVDTETTGLHLGRDYLLSIGAVAIEDGCVDMASCFERTLHYSNSKTNPSVLIHGLGPSALAAGSEPKEALLDFIEYVGDSPLLAFHAWFDQHMLCKAYKEHLGHKLPHPFVDVAEIAPMLFPDEDGRLAGLDNWVGHFGLQVEERHHASADALVTAELCMILFSHARRQGIESAARLEERLGQWRRLKQVPSV